MNSDGLGPIDPQKPQGNPAPRAARLTPEISEGILKSLQERTGTGRVTNEWVHDLATIEPETAQEDIPQDLTSAVGDMLQLMEKLFDFLTKYMYEFNKSLNFTGPQLDVERPAQIKPTDIRPSTAESTQVTGRLSFQGWSLVLRAQAGVIDGYLMPSEQVLRFTADPDASSHQRYLKAEWMATSDGPMWRIGNQPLPLEELSNLAKQLITALVRVAKKGKVTEGFQFVPPEVAPITTVPAHDAPTPVPSPASGHPRAYAPAHGAPTPFPGPAPGGPGGPGPVHGAPTPFPGPAPGGPGGPASAHGAPTPFPGPAPGGPGGLAPAHGAPTPVPGPRPQQPAEPSGATVADALDFVYKGMGRELDRTTSAVNQAFQNQQPEVAEQHIARGTKIKDLQEKTKWLLQQWLSVKPDG